MRALTVLPTRLAGLGLLFTLAFVLAAPSSWAQGYIYALSSQGNVNVNGVQITTLKGGIKVNDFDSIDELNLDSVAWNSIVIDGADWLTLRTDGKLYNSGVQIGSFAFNNTLSAFWIDFTIIGGVPWALRTNGRLNVDGSEAVVLPEGNFFYTRITNDGTNVWSLRSDGRVYLDTDTNPLFQFDAPNQFGENDGQATWTEWIAIVVDPLDGNLYGLRRDGYIAVADPADFTTAADGGPPTVPEVAELKFPESQGSVDVGTVYVALAFLDDGSWLALRGNGQIYAEGDNENALVDLPGDPSNFESSGVFVSLLTVGSEFFSLRQDGNLYVGTDTTEVLDLPKNSYRELAFGTELPDLSNVKTQSPIVTQYAIKGITGEGFVMPVLVADVDTTSDEIVVTADETTIPPGAVWDADALTLTWDDPGPAGSYKFVVSVDNGKSKAVKGTFKIKLSDPDTNPDKNAKPLPAKVKKATALDNEPYSLPILVFDADGDPLTVTVDDTEYPYTAGATFDAKTNTFMWTPAISDVGKVKLAFDVTDDTVTKTLKVKLNVVASLLTFP